MLLSAADRMVAVGRDGTAEHSLHHAAMTAVSAAAADNRRAWPDTPGDGSGGPNAQEPSHSSHASVLRAPQESGAEKRQKQAGCTDVSQGRDLAAHADASKGTQEAMQPPGERWDIGFRVGFRVLGFRVLSSRFERLVTTVWGLKSQRLLESQTPVLGFRI